MLIDAHRKASSVLGVHAPVLNLRDQGRLIAGDVSDKHNRPEWVGVIDPDPNDRGAVERQLVANARGIAAVLEPALALAHYEGCRWDAAHVDLHGAPMFIREYWTAKDWMGWEQGEDEPWHEHKERTVKTLERWWSRKMLETIGRIGIAGPLRRAAGVPLIGYNDKAGSASDYDTPHVYPPKELKGDNPVSITADGIDRILDAAYAGMAYPWMQAEWLRMEHDGATKAQNEVYVDVCARHGIGIARFNGSKPDQALDAWFGNLCSERYAVHDGYEMVPERRINRTDGELLRHYFNPEALAERCGCEVPEFATEGRAG
jgi:hypothetical protein